MRVRPEDTEPTTSSVSLSEALESPANGIPAGARPDLAKLQSLQERIFQNRTRLLDRYNQLPLYGKSRKDAQEKHKCQWKLSGTGGDHPLVQLLLSLRMDEEELDTLRADMEAKDFARAKLSIKSKIADLLLALQKENDSAYSEIHDIVLLDQRDKEHGDRMRHLEGKKDEDLSNAELQAKAKRLGVALNGDPE